MKKAIFVSIFAGGFLMFALNANAVTIQGTAQSIYGPTAIDVGTVVSGGSIDPDINEKVYGLFIPIDTNNTETNTTPVLDNTYGVDEDGDGDGYGEIQDHFITNFPTTPIDGPLMHMWFRFNVPTGETAHTLIINGSDIDMSPFNVVNQTNDPNGFFEELTIFGMVDSSGSDSGSGLLPGLLPFTGQSYDQFDALTDVTVTDLNPSNGLNDFGIVFSNLNITGESWLHMGVRAYSDGDLPDNEWSNIRELVSATISVPDPTTMSLLGIGLAGLAGRGIRRRIGQKKVEGRK